MKKLFALISMLLVISAQAVEIDSIVAQVNSHQILKSEVEAEMIRQGPKAKDFKTTLDEIIDRKLILAAAGKAKMTMQEWVVENRVREIIQSGFEGDRNKLNQMLTRNKIAYTEWYQRIKEDMIITAMRWNTVDKYASASPSAMRKMYEENPERYSEGGSVSISVILLKGTDEADRDKVRKAIKEKSFAEAAKLYSIDTHASEGGMWKDIDPKATFRGEIADAIEAMPTHTISDWIELDGFSFLLQKNEENHGRLKSFVEAYSDIEEDVKDEEAKRIYEAWVKRLRAEAYIKVY